MLSDILGAHPSLQRAVSDALRVVALERPPDPIARLAAVILSHNVPSAAAASHPPSLTAASAASPGPGDGSPYGGAGGGASSSLSSPGGGYHHHTTKGASKGKGRRAGVFSEAVHLDKDFRAPIVPKTPAQEAEITGAISANILFQGMDVDARRTIVGAMDQKARGWRRHYFLRATCAEQRGTAACRVVLSVFWSSFKCVPHFSLRQPLALLQGVDDADAMVV